MSVAVPMFGRALMRIVTPMSGSLFWSLTTPVMRVIVPGCSCGRSYGASDDDLPSREFPGVVGSGEQLFQDSRNGLIRYFQGDFAVDVQDVVVVNEDVVALAFDQCEDLLDGAVLYVERDGFRRLCRLCTDGPDEPDCCQQKQECYPE